jgi:hypothetical protein
VTAVRRSACRTPDCGHPKAEHYRDRFGGGCLGSGTWCGCTRFRRLRAFWHPDRRAHLDGGPLWPAEPNYFMESLARRWRTCRCGDPVAWHRHYRRGRNCSAPGCGCQRPRRGGRPVSRAALARETKQPEAGEVVVNARQTDPNMSDLARRAMDVLVRAAVEEMKRRD